MSPDYDLIIRNGTLYDGSGGPPVGRRSCCQQRGDCGCRPIADIVVFDPASIRDHATFEQPHQYATGVRDVFVNGVQVLRNGEHTGAKPGQVIRGPGWKRT